METREMSQSVNQVEKDVTLNSELAKASEVVVESKEPIEEEQAVEPVAENVRAKYAGMSNDELLSSLEQLVQQPVEETKDEVLAVKAAFFALKKAETVDTEAENQVDEQEVKFKELLNEIKVKRAELVAAQKTEKAENLAKKQSIIDQINAITDDPDNINRQYSKVKQLQQEFKEVGAVPPTNETQIWKSFQQAIEKFYDLLKINKELRDYDFKKNLEIKQQLCSEAEALDENDDVVAAYKVLQELHNTWRETGPVAKEIREELWERFKNASSVIRKKHQAFFEERKTAEKENADAKTALCEKIEEIKTDGLKTYSAWDDATKQIIALQEEWKKLGFASAKVNKALFARFRKSCDEFFAQKAEFFKNMKDELANNLARKTELCEKAEALKDSTDWKATTDALVALQKEWKTIGPVVKKHSDAVWKRFIAACDEFFEAKKKLSNNVHAVEHENLKAKKEVIASLSEVIETGEGKEAVAKVKEFMAKWQEIGHVPFKEKDKIYAEYRAAVDKAYEKFDMKGSKANLANFETNLNQISGDKVYHERERLVRTYETKCNELKTYQNNMGFLNATSKSGNSLVKELERKIDRIKEDIALLEQKIKMIDDKI